MVCGSPGEGAPCPRTPRWLQLAHDGGYHVLSRGHNREARNPVRSKRILAETAERLVQIYDAWGKPEEAAKWRAVKP